MARHRFGGTVADYVIVEDGAGHPLLLPDGSTATVFDVALLPGGAFTVWSARTGGQQILDLLTVSGAGIGNGVVVADANGNIPEFQGPDTTPETLVLYADGGRGRVAMLATDMPALIDAANLRASSALTAAAAAQTRAAQTLFTIEFDTSAGAYPSRAARGVPAGVRVLWIGPSAPPINTSYATDGFDLWLGTDPALTV